jgi:hypothetical protein
VSDNNSTFSTPARQPGNGARHTIAPSISAPKPFGRSTNHTISNGVSPSQESVTTGGILHNKMRQAPSPNGGGFGGGMPDVGHHPVVALEDVSVYQSPSNDREKRRGEWDWPEQGRQPAPPPWQEDPIELGPRVESRNLDYYDRRGIPNTQHPGLGSLVRKALTPSSGDGALEGRVMPRGWIPPIGEV